MYAAVAYYSTEVHCHCIMQRQTRTIKNPTKAWKDTRTNIYNKWLHTTGKCNLHAGYCIQ